MWSRRAKNGAEKDAAAKKRFDKKALGTKPLVGLLTVSCLIQYVAKFDRSHLRLGIMVKGLLMALEQIGLIYWDSFYHKHVWHAKDKDRPRDFAEWGDKKYVKYTAAAAGGVSANFTGWRYSKLFSRDDFPKLKWADKAFGPVTEHKDKGLGSFNLQNVTTYDGEEYLRRWLRTNGPDGPVECCAGAECRVKEGGEWEAAEVVKRVEQSDSRVEAYEVKVSRTGEVKTLRREEFNLVNSHEGKSLCEVILVDDRFKHARPFVSIADVFLSHRDVEPILGPSYHNTNEYGKGRESTMELLHNFDESHKQLEIESKCLWIDLCSLRPCQAEWNPEVVVELVEELGVVVAVIDEEMDFVSRSWCTFELYCAAAAMATRAAERKEKGEEEGKDGSKDEGLYCALGGGYREHAKAILGRTPVQSAEAQCQSDADKAMIDDFIKETLGSNEELDRVVTRALLRSNNIMDWVGVDDDGNRLYSRYEDDGEDDWHPAAYDEYGQVAKWRRPKDGYSGVWEYDVDQREWDREQGEWVTVKGTYEWVRSEPTDEEAAHWDPVFDDEGKKVVRNRWQWDEEKGGWVT